MLDALLDWAVVFLPTILSILGVLVSLKAPRSKHLTRLRVGLVAFGIFVSVVTFWEQSRSRQAHGREVATLNSTLGSVRSELQNVQTATSLLRSEQARETARREQAETDLAIIVRASGQAVREGVVSDIKRSPIKVQVNGQATTPQSLPEVEGLRLFSEPESSTHADAPYAMKVTLQATTAIDPLRVAIRCVNEVKYVEMGYPSGRGEGQMWYGSVEVYKNDHTIVIVNMTGTGKAPIRPDLPLLLHLAASDPIVIKSFERGPR